jgi:hypothetical protein
MRELSTPRKMSQCLLKMLKRATKSKFDLVYFRRSESAAFAPPGFAIWKNGSISFNLVKEHFHITLKRIARRVGKYDPMKYSPGP